MRLQHIFHRRSIAGFKFALDIHNLLDSRHVPGLLLQFVDVSIELGVLLLRKAGSASAGNQGKAQQDIGTSEMGTTQVGAILWRRSELTFQKLKVGLEIWREEPGVDLASNGTEDGLDEKWDFGVLDA